MRRLDGRAAKRPRHVLARRRRGEKGQTKAEYGVVLALVTLAVVGAMTMLSGNISAALSAVAGVFP